MAPKDPALSLVSALSTEAALQEEMNIALPVFMSRDAKEGPRAFKEKREPKFVDK